MTLSTPPRRRRWIRVAAVLALATMLSGTACGGSSSDNGTPTGSGPALYPDDPAKVRGGTLRYALGADVPTLDIQRSTAGVVGLVAWNIFEPLFVRDAQSKIAPMLAKDHTASPDGLRHVVTLREGVRFHNGEPMTAKDVVASLRRWATFNSFGKDLLKATTRIDTPNDHTVEFVLSKPFGAFLSALSYNTQGPAIYPASVIERSSGSELAEVVGTGPYRLDRFEKGRQIRLVRFDNYAALPGRPDGYGGHKAQHLDAIEFRPIPDEAARLAALEAGEVDLVHGSSAEALMPLRGNSNLVVERVGATGLIGMLVNLKSSVWQNVETRRAMQEALDHDQILTAALGPQNYRLDPGLSLKETEWHSTVGGDRYNTHNVDQARTRLQASGYAGQEIRILTSQELPRFYNAAVVVRQQMEAAGFKVKVVTYDWATALDRRGKPDDWDLFVSDWGAKSDPVENPFMRLCSYAGWWCDTTAVGLVDKLLTESDQGVRRTVFEELQKQFYEQVPMIKFGDTIGVQARSTRVYGLSHQQQQGPIVWNVWLER